MRRWTLLACALVTVLAWSGNAGAANAGKLNLYSVTVDASELASLANQGYDIAATEAVASGVRIELVLTGRQAANLRRELGTQVRVVRDRRGRDQQQRAAFQAASGFSVWRSWDDPGGIRDELYALARANPQLLKLEVLGHTAQGREYIAVKLTQGARGIRDGTRPAALYVATHHSREWIGTEVSRRLLRWYIDQWKANKPAIKRLLKDTELWFVLVHNPDGYEYTFDTERLWRKNLHDNDSNGIIDSNDGVDPNRNYPEHWNYDDEGSSSQFSSETYRGVTPGSEPETQALMGLHERIPFKFSISYHSFGNLLLYPQGWQVQTPSADDPIYVALTGDDLHPAVAGFNPGVSADLYTTNGEYTDWAHGKKGTLAWTPELGEGCAGCGFVFPDDEAAIQHEFEINRDFAVRVARSALDPDDPVSHWGIDTQGFYLDISAVDGWKSNNPASDLRVRTSYGGGASQPVEVLAKRALGAVTLRYRINGGAVQTAATSESPNGERFGGNNAYNAYYHYLRGSIGGIAVGNSVEYWFTGGGGASDHVTFNVVEDADADVLIVAAEDRTGASTLPGYTSTSASTPNYLSYYQDALAANGMSYDVYDVDAMGRTAPDDLGVLSHYDAVIWYTGNDLVTREPGWSAGNASRLANDIMLEVRAYLNGGGKVLYTGQWAGALWNGVAGNQFYDPVANERCVVGGVLVLARCQLIADKNDFIQYYLGAYLYNSDGGTDPDTGEPFGVDGVSSPYSGLSWAFNDTDSAQNQLHTASFLTTSSLLKPDVYPQFTSHAPAEWASGSAGSFEPYDGSWYVYSNRADISYKRLMRTVDLTGVSAADAPSLKFRVSYDTELDWDFAFVEAHTVGQDNWTTLPDVNGHTSSSTGESCPAGWFEIHPWLERYQGADCSGANAATGGVWNANSGRSAGWEEWQVDLSQYAGQQVELSISYVSDWSVQGLGSFVDQIQVSHGGGSTSFETGMDGWTIPGPAPGSATSANDWTRTQSVGFEEGAVVATADSLYFGFGFEGISDAATRNDVMGRSMDYLLP
ncbi:MAG: M14 family zinc carboxypeptidase [Gaiellaceae bacterium]